MPKVRVDVGVGPMEFQLNECHSLMYRLIGSLSAMHNTTLN